MKGREGRKGRRLYEKGGKKTVESEREGKLE